MRSMWDRDEDERTYAINQAADRPDRVCGGAVRPAWRRGWSLELFADGRHTGGGAVAPGM
jgi:hypothetical protein